MRVRQNTAFWLQFCLHKIFALRLVFPFPKKFTSNTFWGPHCVWSVERKNTPVKCYDFAFSKICTKGRCFFYGLYFSPSPPTSFFEISCSLLADLVWGGIYLTSFFGKETPSYTFSVPSTIMPSCGW